MYTQLVADLFAATKARVSETGRTSRLLIRYLWRTQGSPEGEVILTLGFQMQANFPSVQGFHGPPAKEMVGTCLFTGSIWHM